MQRRGLAGSMALCLGVVTSLGGCETGSTSSTGSAAVPEPLLIPMEPVESYDAYMMAEWAAAGTLLIEEPLPLALGDGYPERFSMVPTDLYGSGCWKADAEFVLSGVSSASPAAVDARITDGRTVELEIAAAGAVTITATGVVKFEQACGEFPAGEVGVELHIHTDVREVAGAEFVLPSKCAGASTAYVESGAGLLALGVAPTDSSGDAFYPRNASTERPVDLVATAPIGVALSTDSERPGVAGLVATGEGDVVVHAPGGDELQLTVLPSRAISRMDIEFPVLGLGGGGFLLEDGKSYGDLGWARTSDVIGPIVTGLYADGAPLCTVAKPGAFELESATPAVCQVEPHNGHADYYKPTPIGQSARLVADGLCELTVVGPEYSEGGLTAEMSATILNVDSMIDAASR